ncbi:MAG: arginase family protein [Deltaproteobacteria bacterium]|jgi:arginase family enzyme|nr:arginase family protein [Deltaproteobacteria bacterium]
MTPEFDPSSMEAAVLRASHQVDLFDVDTGEAWKAGEETLSSDEIKNEINAISKHLKDDSGILHIDAHANLRVAYQGYAHSHASIMYKVIEKIKPGVLVQVGIRDFSKNELTYSESGRGKDGSIGSGRIVTHDDRSEKRHVENGECFSQVVKSTITDLPQNIYASFDIDGLQPDLCPNTDTPVPGGLTLDLFKLCGSTVITNGLTDAVKNI